MYKQASRLKLRFDVVGAGRLSAEQLWSVNINDLITAEEELQKAVENLGKSGNRRKQTQTKESEELRLKLAIISDVLDTREKEAIELRDAASKKEHNQKIMALIAKKREESLENMTEAELLALLD